MTTEDIRKEIKSLQEQIRLKKIELEKSLKPTLEKYENKYFMLEDGSELTLLFVKEIHKLNDTLYYSDGYFFKFHDFVDPDTGKKEFYYIEFNNDRIYDFKTCLSYEDVDYVLSHDFKEITRKYFFEKVAECNRKYINYIKDLH